MAAVLEKTSRGSSISPAWAKRLALIPRYDSVATAAPGQYFDEKAANRAVSFIEECCQHIEGKFAGKPFVLEPWQKGVVGCLFGWKKPDGSRRYREAFVLVGRGNGKALSLTTRLPTPSGWTTMADVQVGDKLFDENGLPTTVLEKHPVLLNRDCYRVEFSDGCTIDCDGEHLWSVIDSAKHRKVSVLTTADIAKTLVRSTSRGWTEYRYSIPVCGSLHCDSASLPIDPYVLGVWLGDGDSDCPRLTFSRHDTEILSHLAARGVSIGKTRNDKRSSSARATMFTGEPGDGGLVRALRAEGLFGNKHIPAKYLRASHSQRLDLLQGLMDTDGFVSKGQGQAEYCSVNRRLAENVMELVRSLGLKPRLSVGRATVSGKDCGEKYRVIFHSHDTVPIFKMSRKLARLKPKPDVRPMSQSRRIVSVVPIPSVPVQCIRVDSPSSLYLAGEGMIPTHNTPLAAAILCYLLFADGERGAQIYGAAGEREQASLLYRYVRGMVEAEPQLNSRAQVFKGAGQRAIMLRDDPAAGYKVLSSDGETKHGFVPHGVISDELHVWGPLGKPLMEAIETAFAKLARRQPLHLMITTSDFRRDSVCNDKHDYARMVRDGKADDPSFLPVLYELDDGDDWQDESVWHKANPNLGVTVDTEALRREFTKAKEQPSYENSFKRLHLNIRTESDVRWLPMDRWHACPPLDVDALKGKRCWGGLDLASTRDITAMVLAFRLDDGTVALLPRFWVPRDVMTDKSRHRDRQHYQGWIDKGYILTTPTVGKTDYDYIRADINAMRKLYKIQEIAYDPWNAEQVAGQLDKDGASMVKVAQGKAQLTAGAKEFEALVATSQIRHGSNPVLDWMAGNVSVESDAAGNIRPAKDKSLGKIDGIVAAVMAVGRLIVSVKANTVYAERGLVVL